MRRAAWILGTFAWAWWLVAGVPAATPPGQDDAESKTYLFIIADAEFGQERWIVREDGWSCEGWHELPGRPRVEYAAELASTDAGPRWTLELNPAGSPGARVVSRRAGGKVETTTEPGGAAPTIEIDDEAPACFFENLLWACFVDIGRHFVALADRDELEPGATLQALVVRGGVKFDVVLAEFSRRAEESGGSTPPWRFTVSLADTDMELACAADGVPLAIAVPSQQIMILREDMVGTGLLAPRGTSIVDSGAWREQLSPAAYEVEVRRNVRIQMRDGVHLAADVYLPQTEEPAPAILVRTPYNRKSEGASKGTRYARRGYAVIVQDTRGRFDSEGEFTPLFDEEADGSDTLDWIADQEWSTGDVGMIGGSYVGWVQWYAAKSGNPHLKCIVPQVAPPDPEENIPYEGGAFLMSSCWWALALDSIGAGGGLPQEDLLDALATLPLGDLDKVLGTEQPFLDDWLSHPPSDDYWEPARYQAYFGDYDLAALHISGWYDGDQPGSLQNFAGMRRDGATDRARRSQFLLMGPWTHFFNTQRRLGDVDFGPTAVIDLDAVILRFFDHYLKGIDNGMDEAGPAWVFVQGSNRWHAEADWPLPQTRFTDLHLCSSGDARRRDGDGRLLLEPPASGAPFDELVYDPMDLPETNADYSDLSGASATADQSGLADRDDHLDYISPPLSEAVEITGPIEVHLTVSTDAADTDFVAALYRRTPKGEMILVAGGVQRLRYRHGPGTDDPVPPGERAEVVIDCWATSLRVEAGERFHLVVGSNGWPGYARNLNTLEPILTASEPVVARNRVHHAVGARSRLVLPVIPREDAPGLVFEETAQGD